MSAALELIRAVEANGGRIRVEDGWLVIAPEKCRRSAHGRAAPAQGRDYRVARIGQHPAPRPGRVAETVNEMAGFSCVRHPRCFGGVGSLHIAFCEWDSGRGRVPCNRDTFELLLEELGFLMGEVAGVVLVSGLTFREDAEAVGL